VNTKTSYQGHENTEENPDLEVHLVQQCYLLAVEDTDQHIEPVDGILPLVLLPAIKVIEFATAPRNYTICGPC